MVSINYAFREIISKIVYYGPGLSGKTTNLQYVFKKVPSETRGELISLATDADRTLYFDFLPVNVGTIEGFATKFQLYTVPGQVYYNATRKLVLRGVDGLVFVADSQVAKMDENIESIKNLKDNLEEYGYDLSQIPMVIQYNKRDLPNIASIAELEKILNPGGLPYFEAVAVTGDGVFKTLKAISKMVLDQVKAKRMEQPKIIKTQPSSPAQPPTPALAPTPPPAHERPAPKTPVGVAAGGGTRPKAVEPVRPSPPRPEMLSRSVEVPEAKESKVRSMDKIGTNNVETAVISDSGPAHDSEIPARVVVSDTPVEKNGAHEDVQPRDNDYEEMTEKAVINDEASDSNSNNKAAHIAPEPGLTNNGYSEVSPETQNERTRVWPQYGGGGGSNEQDDELGEMHMKSPLPLRKPQMAESRKVKNKTGKLSIFGWFKKSKK